MNTKILLGWIILSSLAIAWVAWASFGWFWKNDFDRETIKNMSSEERQVFMEERKSEMAERKANHFQIMTKVLNKEELTSDEEAILEEMKTHRAEKAENMGEYKKWFGKKRGTNRWGENFGKQRWDCMNKESL